MPTLRGLIHTGEIRNTEVSLPETAGKHTADINSLQFKSIYGFVHSAFEDIIRANSAVSHISMKNGGKKTKHFISYNHVTYEI